MSYILKKAKAFRVYSGSKGSWIQFFGLFFRGKAPIASMDAMEDMDLLSGSNTHLSKLSSDGNMAASAGATAASTVASVPAAIKIAASNEPTIFPGIKYRNIGKTGLKCSNIGLGN